MSCSETNINFSITCGDGNILRPARYYQVNENTIDMVKFLHGCKNDLVNRVLVINKGNGTITVPYGYWMKFNNDKLTFHQTLPSWA